MGRPSTKCLALQGAYKKGYRARLAERPKASPYPDWRTYYGSVTFSRAFDRYWRNGWEDADQDLQVRGEA